MNRHIHMTRTTILADDSLLFDLRSISQRLGVSVSEVIRQALADFVKRHKKEGSYPSFLGAGCSGGALRVSEKDEDLLFQNKPRKRR